MRLFPDSFIDQDPSDMFENIKNFPDNLISGAEIAERAVQRDYDFENILFLGMGGSAIGGDIVRSVYQGEIKKPFTVNRDYDIPGFVSDRTLVIASSYSGNTEETLSALEQCTEFTEQIVCITTGGKLRIWAESRDKETVLLPAGLPPRAALGYSLSATFTVLSRLGIITASPQELKDVAAWLANNNGAMCENSSDNPAQRLATKIFTGLPVIYTADSGWSAVGTRFRGQIEENAKMLAYSSVFPEMNHNEIVGLELLGDLYPVFRPIFIVDGSIHPRIRRRMQLTIEEMRNKGLCPLFIEPEGDSLLQKVLYTIHFGDFASFYLAILNKVDPTPVAIIENLKKRLADS